MSRARRIAVLGAESTGKTTLARDLSSRIAQVTGQRVACVDEVLREWCEREGRTPRADEQWAIAHEQHARIDAAALAHDWVVADTTALMTAVYSTLIFGDTSLDAPAAQWHRTMDLTLLTALDLPWVADGPLRDGPHVQRPVDADVRRRLLAMQLPFSVIGGSGAMRLEQALAAVAAHWSLPSGGNAAPESGEPPRGWLARTLNGTAPRRGRWNCECCVPEAERASRAGR